VKGLPGCELSLDPGRGRAERLYARVLGAPANGLRIRLRRVLPATDGDHRTILDAGSGSGVFSFELAKRHPQAQVLGIELEPQLVERANEIARRAGLANCRFETGDVTRLEFDRDFDLVVSVDNFEHVEDDVTAMKKLWQALRPGGTLVAHVPARERRWLLFGRRVNFDVPGHVRPGYRIDELAEKLRRAGFEIDDPLTVPPIFELIQEMGEVTDEEMRDVFNLGCGFCCVVAADDEAAALDLLGGHYPNAKRIGRATAATGLHFT